MQSRIFKSGNSLAVRIPKEIAFDEAVQDVEIERHGEVLTVRPVKRKTLSGVMKVFASFSADFMAGGREVHRHKERDWSALDEG